jgi:hypothetical protein
MRASLFQDAATLYEKSDSTTITRHRIEHPTLGNFCVSLNSFYSELGELVGEDYWRKFLIPLKRLQFGLCAAPFPKDYRFDRVSTIAGELRQHLQFCPKLYPDLAGTAFTILDLLAELLDEPRDPLLDNLLELTSAEQKVAWVIKESRLISNVEELVAELDLPDLSVIHPFQLKNISCYDQIIVIGPSRWFPESIFTAPRANQIDILIFDWIRDRWKPQNVFVSPHKSSGASNRNHITVEERETSNRWDNVDPQNLLIIVDQASSLASTLNNEGDRDEYERVEAVCMFLENDWAVFIEGSEGAKTLVIDPDEDTDSRIARVLVKEIRSGMFILVRTGGGGDYIVPVADKIMGDQASKNREHQKRWKELLRNYARKNGLLKTSIDLLDLGSNLANEINVQNWMSPRSIRTQNHNDFLAIMKLVGLEDQSKEYWAMMKRINHAHHKAGFEIRKLLLEQVKDLNMEMLQKQGKMNFKLSGDDEGSLTAFRVEGVLSKIIEIPYSRIGKPFKLEDQLWPE